MAIIFYSFVQMVTKILLKRTDSGINFKFWTREHDHDNENNIISVHEEANHYMMY